MKLTLVQEFKFPVGCSKVAWSSMVSLKRLYSPMNQYLLDKEFLIVTISTTDQTKTVGLLGKEHFNNVTWSMSGWAGLVGDQ